MPRTWWLKATISLPLFLVFLSSSQKSQQVFTLTSLCSLIIKVKTYTIQRSLKQCYICQWFGHTWVHCRQPPRCLWFRGFHHHQECPKNDNGVSIPKCCNCELQHPRSYRRCSCIKKKLQHYQPHKAGPRVPSGCNFTNSMPWLQQTSDATMYCNHFQINMEQAHKNALR
jgi:hypothetical protein